MTQPRVTLIAIALACTLVPDAAIAADAGAPVAAGPEPTVRFNRDIRPILSDKCFACHGPDAAHVKGDLRLDLRDSAIKANKDGRIAIVPGDSAASVLVQRITSADPKKLMPPPELHKPLDADEIDTLGRWVAAGAEYEPHWAYAPLTRPDAPAVKDAAWPAGDVDRFVLARIEDAGRKPAPDADRVTLIRRLTLDLTGLPPTPAEIDAFLADASADYPGAYEKLVDRLLASRHYGERMAVWWLDLARYADSNGYHGDNPRQMWLYRDYVIEAFNANKPYDRFVVEQIAGDLMPDATREQRVASAYNRLLQTTQEGGAQAKEYYAKYLADRARNTATAFLGSTLGCAECHNHKFDPFTIKDFYAFGAFFADIKEAAVGGPDHVKMPTDKEAEQLAALDATIAQLKKSLDTQTPQLDAALAAWEAEQIRQVEWVTLEPTEVKSAGGATYTRLDDGSYLASGENPQKDTLTITVPLPPTHVATTGLRLHVMPDDSLPSKGPGRAGNGNFVLSRFVVKAGDAEVELAAASASHDQKDYGVAGSIAKGNGWAILPQAGKANEAWFEIADDLGDGTPLVLTITMEFNFGVSATLGRFRLSATTAARPLQINRGVPENIAAIVKTPAAERDDKQTAALAAHFRSITPLLDAARKQIADAEAERKTLDASLPQLVITQTLDKPREVRVLPRGNWLDDSGELVTPAIPKFLGSLDTPGTGDKPATRLDLARWMVAPDNPLTARVLVNRLWMLMFGHALARNPYDIGSQGPWPTHPQLIDRLAADMIAHGWDIKRTMKTIAMSRAYRQSSAVDPATRAADPFNTLFARQTIFRLDAESVRDSALAISGLLKPDIGGPSVFPYQPAGYWQHLKFPNRQWKNDTGEAQHRRGLYTWWQRTFLQPSMLAFDAPSREECVAQRTRSNTPLQSLVLLNDPTYVEAARKFAERIVKDGDPENAEDGVRLGWAMRQATGRAATPAEIAVLGEVLAGARDEYAQPDGEAAATKLLATGQVPRDQSIDAKELAAWTQVARAVLNLHEVITRN